MESSTANLEGAPTAAGPAVSVARNVMKSVRYAKYALR
jgi:hypothetical protein